MLELIDNIVVNLKTAENDCCLEFRRVDGNPESRVIYFLPWNTSFRLAQCAQFLALDFLACYEVPPALVSSEPELCVRAFEVLVKDCEAVIQSARLEGSELTFVGLSVGSLPATFLANRLRARVCSIASFDRGDLMLWQSQAARHIKERARRKGYRLRDFVRAMRGYNPIENLGYIRSNSAFVFGSRDCFVPESRWRGLKAEVDTQVPGVRAIVVDAGHIRTMLLSRSLQFALGKKRKAKSGSANWFPWPAIVGLGVEHEPCLAPNAGPARLP